MQSDVFGIARGARNCALFMGRPGDHARAKSEAVAANRATSVRAICIV